MKDVRCIAVVVLGLGLSACSPRVVAQNYVEVVSSMSDTVAAKRKRALAGDAKSAYELWYSYSVDDTKPKEAHFWLKLGAENGGCESILQMARETTYVYPDYDAAAGWMDRFVELKCPAPDSFDGDLDGMRRVWNDPKKRESQAQYKHSMIHSGQRFNHLISEDCGNRPEDQ